MNIFVAKLNFDVQSEDLLNAFSPFGEVVSADVIMDKLSNRSRGFGFVEMENEEEGLKAISELDGTELNGKTIVVKKAEPRKDRTSR